jgi:uncharacterized iron-regulated membrane protein
MHVGLLLPAGGGLAAAWVDLNHPSHFVQWGSVSISLANFIVILLMVVVFILAVILPFPGGRRS